MKIYLLTIITLSTLLFGCADKAELLASPSPEVLAQIQPYITPSIEFAQANEKKALAEGVELTANEKKIAERIGIKNIDKIRVMYVKEFPFPQDKQLAELARTIGFDSPFMGGFTYGYGVYIREGRYDRELIVHELVHVKQYEEMGIAAFMDRYMLELAVMGYRNAPLEVEAYNRATQFN